MSQHPKRDSLVEKFNTGSRKGNEHVTRPPSTTGIADFARQDTPRFSPDDSQRTTINTNWTNILAGTDYTKFTGATTRYAGSLWHSSNASSQQLARQIGGSHQQNDVKLPGYWTHERSAELRKQARQSRFVTTSRQGTDAHEDVRQHRNKYKGKNEKAEGQRGNKTESFMKSIFRRKA